MYEYLIFNFLILNMKKKDELKEKIIEHTYLYSNPNKQYKNEHDCF